MKEKISNFIGTVFLVTIVLHAIVFFQDGKDITAPFTEKPKPGYVWRDNGTNTSRLFWKGNPVTWTQGIENPTVADIVSAEKEGTWIPKPGYEWRNTENINDGVEWKPGQIHPTIYAFSMTAKDNWSPMPGYKFIYSDEGLVSGTEWEPGQNIDWLHLTSAQQPGNYIPYPGYDFTNSNAGNKLEVAWTPGVAAPGNNNLVAGETEGTWIENPTYTTTESTTAATNEPNSGTILGEILGNAIAYNLSKWWNNGEETEYARKVKEEAAINSVKLAVTAYKESND